MKYKCDWGGTTIFAETDEEVSLLKSIFESLSQGTEILSGPTAELRGKFRTNNVIDHGGWAELPTIAGAMYLVIDLASYKSQAYRQQNPSVKCILSLETS